MFINFVFIRHGESCQQLIKRDKDFNEKINLLYDPELSNNGEINSIRSGEFLHNVLEKGIFTYDVRQYSLKDKVELKIDNFDIIGCSSMLRSIETAYYMSLLYKPSKIYVFPYLRECYDCSGQTTINIGRENEIFKLKTIDQQKKELQKKNINNINYKYVTENNLREKPGHIENFLNWFIQNVNLPSKETINVLIITHSKVMHKFITNVVNNNVGFILMTKINENNELEYSKENLAAIWPNQLYKKFKCPTTRCIELC